MHLPPINEVFHADYRYSSSTVPDLVRHFAGYADWLDERLHPGAAVLEFGCNDGVLLSLLRERGFAVVGVDASDNVASLARSKGVDARTGFFSRELVEREGLTGRFDLITCSNVFAHIHDLRETIAAARAALRPGGLFAIEVHDGHILAGEAQFDTIYHEHLTYFTAETLRDFVERESFRFVEVERTDMHGGGLRLLARYDPAMVAREPSFDGEMLDGTVLAASVARCRKIIERLTSQYGQIDGYGAAGRSQMFINIVGVGHCFARVFDDSPFRQDRFIVGTDVPIEGYHNQEGQCCVILAWNYAPTISKKLAGRYENIITLLPELTHW
jgi:D-mycarose 3-C-methyltransferase